MRLIIALMAVLLLAAGAVPAGAQEVRELLGSWIIDGYTFQPGDRSPRGTIAYDGDANVFKGTYVGLKLPAQRPELHAWLYNTQTKRALHLGKVGLQDRHSRQDQGRLHADAAGRVQGREVLGVRAGRVLGRSGGRCGEGARRQQDPAGAEARVLSLRGPARRQRPRHLLRPRPGLLLHVEPGPHLLRLTLRPAVPRLHRGR